jgi:hypothetical protein
MYGGMVLTHRDLDPWFFQKTRDLGVQSLLYSSAIHVWDHHVCHHYCGAVFVEVNLQADVVR